jgi:hypothetical protein
MQRGARALLVGKHTRRFVLLHELGDAGILVSRGLSCLVGHRERSGTGLLAPESAESSGAPVSVGPACLIYREISGATALVTG